MAMTEKRTQCNGLQAEIVAMHKAIDVTLERLPFVVDQIELGEAMCAVVEVGHRVHALVGQVGLACRLNGVAAVNGHRTVGQYVAVHTGGRAVDVDRHVKRSRWLRDFPVFAAAAGVELTTAHVDCLRKLDTSYDTRAQLIADQQIFVDAAAGCSFAGFEQACEYWVGRNDPDGKEPKDQIEKSRFGIRKGQGGRGIFTGECDAVAAHDISTAVEHEAEKIRQGDKLNGVERTAGQRKSAALAALVKRGFARQDGTFPVPLGNIVMSQAVAEWALNTLAGADPGEFVPVHPTNVDGRCELIDGTPIHPFLAVHALGLIGSDGVADPVNLRRYVMEADSRLLDVSVNSRFFPEWMKTAAHLQSRGRCENPGCDAPFSWLQADHIQPVHHGGQTRFDNMQDACRPDNHAKGSSPNLTAWRNQPLPPRRKPRHRCSPPDDDPDDRGNINF